jgi:hypothetical protein
VRSQKLLSVTEATAGCTRKHARDCVRRASGLVLTRDSDIGLELFNFNRPLCGIIGSLPGSAIPGPLYGWADDPDRALARAIVI